MAYGISKNFTRLWNEIPENAKLFSGNGYKLITYLLRETIGFGRNSVTLTKRKISKHTGICMDKVQIYTKELKELELISITHNVGANITYHIVDRDNWTHPHLKEVRGLPQKGNDPPTKKDGGSRGAKKSIKENFKEKEDKQFLLFKKYFTKHTPTEKWDEKVTYEIFSKLNDEDKGLLLDALPFQNNIWCKPDFDHKYTPKASNYLIKQCFLDEEIQHSVRLKKARINKEIEYKKYVEENKKNAATQEEIGKIIKAFKLKNGSK